MTIPHHKGSKNEFCKLRDELGILKKSKLYGKRNWKEWKKQSEGEKAKKAGMIRSVMVMNTQGKPRLAKFYDFQVPLSIPSTINFCRIYSYWLIINFLFISAGGEAAGADTQRFWRFSISYALNNTIISLIFDSFINLYFYFYSLVQ